VARVAAWEVLVGPQAAWREEAFEGVPMGGRTVAGSEALVARAAQAEMEARRTGCCWWHCTADRERWAYLRDRCLWSGSIHSPVSQYMRLVQ